MLLKYKNNFKINIQGMKILNDLLFAAEIWNYTKLYKK